MGRKVKTPKFLMRDFSINLLFILSTAILFTILLACMKEIDTTVYKDNHLKVKIENEYLIIKNSNEVDVNIMILSGEHKLNFVVGAWSTNESIKLLSGTNKIFVNCEYFEDNFDVLLK